MRNVRFGALDQPSNAVVLIRDHVQACILLRLEPFNRWGTADLLYAIYDGNVVSRIDPGMLGAAFFIPTVVVPALLVAHVLTFRQLLVGTRQMRGSL